MIDFVRNIWVFFTHERYVEIEWSLSYCLLLYDNNQMHLMHQIEELLNAWGKCKWGWKSANGQFCNVSSKSKCIRDIFCSDKF